MNKILPLILVMTFIYSLSDAQIVSQSVDLVAFCCGDGDSLDIENDGVYDIRIYAEWGFDSKHYFIEGLHPEILVSNAVDSGSTFSFHQPYNSIAGTQLSCWWYEQWKPKGGIRYSGFERINAANDTTFGWVKMDFWGDSLDCIDDTIVAFEITYNTVSNQPLWAGQKVLLSGINDVDSKHIIEAYPNPAHSDISVINKTDELLKTTLCSTTGQVFLSSYIERNSTVRFSTYEVPSGIYFLYSYSDRQLSSVRQISISH